MPRLLSINDLYDPTNDWKSLLPTIAWLEGAYKSWKVKDTGFNRVIPVHMGNDLARSPGLHASELNTCIRQAAYALRGEERCVQEESDGNPNMKMRFDLGKMVHALIQDDFEHICIQTRGVISFEDEVKIWPGMGGVAAQYNYASSSDGIFTFSDQYLSPYIRLGLEIKTMSADEFDKANKPKDAHIQQGTLYQKCLDIPLMWYLYYNKSNSNWTPPTAPWIVPFDRNEWAKIEARSAQAHSHTQQGTLPDREEGMHCKWCAFAKTCNPAILKLHSTARYRSTARRIT